MVLGREERLACKVLVLEMRLEYMSNFKYLGYILDEPGTPGTYSVECRRKVVNGRTVMGNIRSLVNDWSLQVGFARVLHEALFVTFLLYGS